MRERQEEAKRVEEGRFVGGTERSERPIPPGRGPLPGLRRGRQRWTRPPPATAARQCDSNSNRLGLALVVLALSDRR